MRRLFLFLLFQLFWIPVISQQEFTFRTVSGKSPDCTVDVREFALSMAAGADNMSMRSAPRITHPTDTAINWIDRIHNMPQYMKDFYNLYANCVEKAFNGESSWLTDPEMGVELVDEYGDPCYCVIINKWNETISFTMPADQDGQFNYYVDSIFNDHIRLIEDTISCFMPYLIACLNYDIPEAFWIGNEYSWTRSRNYTSVGSYSYDGKTINGTINYSFQLMLILESYDFRFIIPEFGTPESVFDGIVEYNGLIQNILKELPDTSTYHQIKYLNNWLTTHNSYSSASYYGKEFPTISRSPMSALKGSTGYNGPVCEGYSRAFKILCDKIGVPATLAVGNARSYPDDIAEGHMWNEVKMDDGKWYGVDVTWNDPERRDKMDVAQSGSENEEWLLLGKKSIVHDWAFEDSHPFSLDGYDGYADFWDCRIQSFLGDYSYDVPNSVSDTFIDREVIEVHSLTGSVIGIYDSIDEALEHLSKGVYIIGDRKYVVK